MDPVSTSRRETHSTSLWQRCCRPKSISLIQIAAVAGIALLLLSQAFLLGGIGQSFQDKALCPIPTFNTPPGTVSCDFVSDNFFANLKPDQFEGYSHFPAHLSKFMNNQLVLAGEGERACHINEHPEIFEICEQFSANAKKIVENDPQFQKSIKKSGKKDLQEKGLTTTINVQNQIYQFNFGMNPKKQKNFQTAMKFIEEKMLKRTDFYEQPVKSLVATIKKTHSILLNQLEAGAGEYRNSEISVYFNEYLYTFEDFYFYLRDKLKASREELQAFESGMKKFAQPDIMTAKELSVMNKLFYFPPSPRKISKLMNQFAKEWLTYGKQDIHPISLASWVHCQIGQIHPFSDANGRLARLLMNGVLSAGGYTPVIFHDDNEYQKAMQDENTVPGSFTKYLIKEIDINHQYKFLS